MNRTARFRVLVVLCLLLAALAWAWWSAEVRRRAQQPALAVLVYLGVTNVNPGGPYAVLQLTNASLKEIIYVPTLIEQRTGSEWHDLAFNWSVGDWPGFMGRPLQPRQSATFLVPAPSPTNSLPWRIHLRCSEHRGLLDEARDWLRGFPRFPDGRVRFYRGRRYDLVSPEIITPTANTPMESTHRVGP